VKRPGAGGVEDEESMGCCVGFGYELVERSRVRILYRRSNGNRVSPLFTRRDGLDHVVGWPSQ
jgi:hypothetical protein